jgi:hypothetical protein
MTILYAAKWDKGGNRQVIRTGCRPFDTQISALGQGNVFGSTITGWYIRPYGETECNGYTVPQGDLQAFDLRPFGSLPVQVAQAVTARARTHSGILYKLFHSATHQIVHGYIWTDYDDNLVDLWVTGRNKSTDVVVACLPYMVNVETLDVGLLTRAMTYHAEPAPVPSVGSVFRYALRNPGDAPADLIIEHFSDGTRRAIIEAAGYVFGKKRWFWRDGTTMNMPYFFPASMFDSRFERVN